MKRYGTGQKSRRAWDGWAGLALLLAGLIFVVPRLAQLDLALYDESVYLNAGVRLAELGWPNAENAPLYVLHHRLLAVLQPDRIAHYYLNYGLLSVVLPLGFFVFCRRQRLGVVTAFLFSCVLLLSQMNFPMDGKVSSFTSLLMLLLFQ